MRNLFIVILTSVLIILLVGLPIFFSCTPVGVSTWNNWFHAVQKADDDTNYDTLKKVEDTCRAMISSYNSDKLVYEQYKNSEKEEEQSWAQQSKIRANRTASTYNNYILQNNYVWKNNVPSDICSQLQYIE